MKAIFLSLYYRPEQLSSCFLLEDKMTICNSVGYETFLLCPNPVRNLKREDIKHFKKDSETKNDFCTIVRFECLSLFEQNYFFRLLRCKHFLKRALSWIKKQKDIDVIFIPSNPPAIWAKRIEKYAIRNNIKTVFISHDIYPEILNKKSFINSYIGKRVASEMNNANYVVTLSETMKKSIVEKGVSESHVIVIPPWSYESLPLGTIERHNLFNELKYDIPGIHFSYIGNVGAFQGLNDLIKAADCLKGTNRYLHIIGNGRRQVEIWKKAETNPNIFVHKAITQDEAKEAYSFGQANIISLNHNTIFYACPSKTPLCIESGKPIILISEQCEYSRYLAKENDAVFQANPGDISSISEIFLNFRPHENATQKSLNTRKISLTLWTNLIKLIKKDNI